MNAQAHAYRASRRSRACRSHACRASRRSSSSSRATCLRRSRTPVMTASVALSWPFARDCSMMKRLSSIVMGAYCIAFLASPSNCRGGGGGAAILPDLKSTRTSPTPELLRVATRLLARRRMVRVAADIFCARKGGESGGACVGDGEAPVRPASAREIGIFDFDESKRLTNSAKQTNSGVFCT